MPPTGRLWTRRSALQLAAAACAAPLRAKGLTRDLYAFDNGTGRDQKIPADMQAEMVKRCGYAGINFTGTQNVPQFLAALDARGLKMVSFYVPSFVDGRTPAWDPGIPQAIEQLKGRETMLLLTVQGTADSDVRAVSIVRDIARLAAAGGLRVCLYPHYGYYVQRVEHALSVAEATGQSNVGVAFNLCHWLRSGDAPNMKMRLAQARPRLMMVNINGADHTGDWDRLIQTLDRGDFDLLPLLQELDALGYQGPFGLQCYQVQGDREENLKRSMAAWRRLRERVSP